MLFSLNKGNAITADGYGEWITVGEERALLPRVEGSTGGGVLTIESKALMGSTNKVLKKNGTEIDWALGENEDKAITPAIGESFRYHLTGSTGANFYFGLVSLAKVGS
jgi:hypothetical protein